MTREVRLSTVGLIERVEGHDVFKKYMLDYIDNKPLNRLVERNTDVSHTDWSESDNKNREYVNKFTSLISYNMKTITNRLSLSYMDITDIWFQQYSRNAEHSWHGHFGSDWAGIYYVEMPNERDKTLLWDYHSSKIVDDIDLHEGDMFVFPSTILHCSPLNITDTRKTVISFNMKVGDVTRLY